MVFCAIWAGEVFDFFEWGCVRIIYDRFSDTMRMRFYVMIILCRIVILSEAKNLEYIKWVLPRSFASLWMTLDV